MCHMPQHTPLYRPPPLSHRTVTPDQHSVSYLLRVTRQAKQGMSFFSLSQPFPLRDTHFTLSYGMVYANSICCLLLVFFLLQEIWKSHRQWISLWIAVLTYCYTYCSFSSMRYLVMKHICRIFLTWFNSNKPYQHSFYNSALNGA